MAEKRDYYEVLGLQKGATADEIKKAYRRLAKENHPDLHPGDKACEERFKEINEAYVQDEQTREVLMMAWMNEEAVRRTISQGTTWFWSRSRQKFWHKGEESGNTQKLVELRYDCDADTLLAVVNPAGPACHTGETTCFYRSF